MSERPPQPGLELLTRGAVALGEPLDLGVTPEGHRRVVPISSGRFEGPRIAAEVLPGGADWQVIRPGGWVSVLARYTLRADDGMLISVTSRGLRHGPPEVMARLLAGESPDPASYRFRTAVAFEAAEESWVNHVLAICSAVRLPDAVLLDIYEVT
ncbi:MAG: DUF3237 domain-containing protein [Solirubrobacteraceae bacterium]